VAEEGHSVADADENGISVVVGSIFINKLSLLLPADAASAILNNIPTNVEKRSRRERKGLEPKLYLCVLLKMRAIFLRRKSFDEVFRTSGNGCILAGMKETT